MREVVTYITKDGLSFHDKDSALEHEAAIEFTSKYRSGHMQQLGNTNAPRVVDWLIDNKIDVLKLYGVNYE